MAWTVNVWWTFHTCKYINSFFVSDLHLLLNMFVVIEYRDGHNGGWGHGSGRIRGGKEWGVGEERLGGQEGKGWEAEWERKGCEVGEEKV